MGPCASGRSKPTGFQTDRSQKSFRTERSATTHKTPKSKGSSTKRASSRNSTQADEDVIIVAEHDGNQTTVLSAPVEHLINQSQFDHLPHGDDHDLRNQHEDRNR